MFLFGGFSWKTKAEIKCFSFHFLPLWHVDDVFIQIILMPENSAWSGRERRLWSNFMHSTLLRPLLPMNEQIILYNILIKAYMSIHILNKFHVISLRHLFTIVGATKRRESWISRVLAFVIWFNKISSHLVSGGCSNEASSKWRFTKWKCALWVWGFCNSIQSKKGRKCLTQKLELLFVNN